MKKKNKQEYLHRKKLKEAAKKRESEHKVDYTNCPVRDNRARYERDTHFGGDGVLEMALIMSMMRMRKRNPMWGTPKNKK